MKLDPYLRKTFTLYPKHRPEMTREVGRLPDSTGTMALARFIRKMAERLSSAVDFPNPYPASFDFGLPRAAWFEGWTGEVQLEAAEPAPAVPGALDEHIASHIASVDWSGYTKRDLVSYIHEGGGKASLKMSKPQLIVAAKAV